MRLIREELWHDWAYLVSAQPLSTRPRPAFPALPPILRAPRSPRARPALAARDRRRSTTSRPASDRGFPCGQTESKPPTVGRASSSRVPLRNVIASGSRRRMGMDCPLGQDEWIDLPQRDHDCGVKSWLASDSHRELLLSWLQPKGLHSEFALVLRAWILSGAGRSWEQGRRCLPILARGGGTGP
jgi:hypothetical protein